MKSPIYLLTSLLADVGRLDPHAQGLDRDIQTIHERFEDEGIGFITIAFSRFADHFDRWLANREVDSVPGFRKKPRSSLPAFLSGLTCLVFDASTGKMLEKYDMGAIKSIRQILRIFRKSLISENEDLLHRKQERQFSSLDASIPQVPRHLIADLRHVGFLMLNGIERKLDTIFESCRHGPGAVAEGVLSNQKWLKLVEQIEEFDLFPESQYDLLMVDSDKGVFSNGSVLPKSNARFVSVPKSVSSRRGITIEPLMKQFYQQGINRLLRDWIDSSPLSAALDLTDQSKNQLLALEGSRTGYWATLDLSSASDLLSVELVSTIFHSQPNLLGYMLETRSALGASPMKKYAGMGNATTFPVQSIVFAALAAYAITRRRCETVSAESLKRSLRCVRVFGDDIIVPSECATLVGSLLEECGLKVNRSKSFWEGNFRESCGVDAFEGVDVTNIYYRLDPRQTAYSDGELETMVSTSNQMWLEGYYSLSDAIRKLVEKDRGNLPFVIRGSGNVGWVTRHRVVIKQRYDSKLQRPLYKVLKSLPRRRKDAIGGIPALMKFFLTTLLERSKGHLRESVQRYSNQVRWRWVPVIPVTSSYLP